jgi:V8-like Glu-specific endopeptidase
MATQKKVTNPSGNKKITDQESLERIIGIRDDRTSDPLFVPHLSNLPEMMGAESVSNQEDYSDILETICGVADDSQDVERYNGTLGVTTAFVNAHQKPVCQVQWNNNLASIYTNPGNVSDVRWGTGTMISDDLMITCGHLFDQTGGGWNRPRINGTTNIISPQEIARQMHVNFNYQVNSSGTLRTEESFPIIELIEYRLGGIDMALCRIGGTPGARFGKTNISRTDAAEGDMICIIGHPAGRPKRIEAGPTTDINDNRIHYNDIDTLGGNSGSGILHANTGRLVGIHTNGGCTPASPADGGSNFGQRIEAVVAVSPTLQQLLTKSVASDFSTPRTDKPIISDIHTTWLADKNMRSDVFTTPLSDFRKNPLENINKRFNDTKTHGLDKAPGMENIGRFNNIFNPVFSGIGTQAGARPFVLSTPHHAEAFAGETQPQATNGQQIQEYLEQYEQAIAATEQQLHQLLEEYKEALRLFYSGNSSL